MDEDPFNLVEHGFFMNWRHLNYARREENGKAAFSFDTSTEARFATVIPFKAVAKAVQIFREEMGDEHLHQFDAGLIVNLANLVFAEDAEGGGTSFYFQADENGPLHGAVPFKQVCEQIEEWIEWKADNGEK